MMAPDLSRTYEWLEKAGRQLNLEGRPQKDTVRNDGTHTLPYESLEKEWLEAGLGDNQF